MSGAAGSPSGGRRSPHRATSFCLTLLLLVALGTPASAQTGASALQGLNAAIAELTAKVSPSVVQVLVTGFRVGDVGNGGGVAVHRARGSGSGAIVDANGYIVTNAHVVEGAEQIRVLLHVPSGGASPLSALSGDQGRAIPAQLVGVARDTDLALLKIDRKGLVPLPMADYDTVRQGELVFAFGSPEGLRDSVSMGVVSTTARQLEADSPSVYIQTDAPINPGNSGGPLVNTRGELVGLNSFLISPSGGGQGLGFAIPSAVVAATYQQLRTYGHPNRGSVGIQVQGVTPALAEGLHLERMTGVVVSDVQPDSPADRAGVSVRDIILTVNDRPIDSVPLLTLAVAPLQPGESVTLELLRGAQRVRVPLTVGESPNPLDRLSQRGNPESAVPALGVVGVDVDDRVRTLLPHLRVPDGVLVTDRWAGADAEPVLVAGDVIHSLDIHKVSSLATLQVLTEGLAPHSEVVLQIEREGRLQFVVLTIP